MKRREFIAALGGAVIAPQTARAQGSSKIPRLGFLGVTVASSWASRLEAAKTLGLSLPSLALLRADRVIE